jgi:hypothetical protein
MATKKTKTSTGRLNKSAWIRAQPASLSAKEVVDKAKSDGVKLSLAQVYTARSTAKNRSGAGAQTLAGGTKRGPGRPKVVGSSGARGDVQQQFLALAVRLGTDEAKRLLDRIVAGQFRA